MTTRDRDRDAWLENLDSPERDGGPADSMPRSRAAREEVVAAFAALSASVVDRVLSQDHEGFLNSVRQSGGQ